MSDVVKKAENVIGNVVTALEQELAGVVPVAEALLTTRLPVLLSHALAALQAGGNVPQTLLVDLNALAAQLEAQGAVLVADMIRKIDLRDMVKGIENRLDGLPRAATAEADKAAVRAAAQATGSQLIAAFALLGQAAAAIAAAQAEVTVAKRYGTTAEQGHARDQRGPCEAYARAVSLAAQEAVEGKPSTLTATLPTVGLVVP